MKKLKRAVIDIDGVLNYYPQTFIDYCNDTYGTTFTTLQEVKEHLSYATYKERKEEYRCSDYKNRAVVREDAYQMLEYLRRTGWLIYIITSRPLFKYNLLENTILWLKENKLEYDYIYCTQKKDYTIFEKFGYVDLVVEDNCDNVEKIMEINGKAHYYVINNHDNLQYHANKKIKRVDNIYDILNDLEKDEVEEYDKEKNPN